MKRHIQLKKEKEKVGWDLDWIVKSGNCTPELCKSEHIIKKHNINKKQLIFEQFK